MLKIDLELGDGCKMEMDSGTGPDSGNQEQLMWAIALLQGENAQGVANVLGVQVGESVVNRILALKGSENNHRELLRRLFSALGTGETLGVVVRDMARFKAKQPSSARKIYERALDLRRRVAEGVYPYGHRKS